MDPSLAHALLVDPYHGVLRSSQALSAVACGGRQCKKPIRQIYIRSAAPAATLTLDHDNCMCHNDTRIDRE